MSKLRIETQALPPGDPGYNRRYRLACALYIDDELHATWTWDLSDNPRHPCFPYAGRVREWLGRILSDTIARPT